MEYQITVSLNGLFLFRTNWEADVERVKANVTMLCSSMMLATVNVVSRSRTLKMEPAKKFLEGAGRETPHTN